MSGVDRVSDSIRAKPGMVIKGSFRLDPGSSVVMEHDKGSTEFKFQPGPERSAQVLVVVDVSTPEERAMSVLRLRTMNPPLD